MSEHAFLMNCALDALRTFKADHVIIPKKNVPGGLSAEIKLCEESKRLRNTILYKTAELVAEQMGE